MKPRIGLEEMSSPDRSDANEERDDGRRSVRGLKRTVRCWRGGTGTGRGRRTWDELWVGVMVPEPDEDGLGELGGDSEMVANDEREWDDDSRSR